MKDIKCVKLQQIILKANADAIGVYCSVLILAVF
jgi:hypothetical protein